MAKAKVIDKTFNLDHGCIHFTIQDHLGRKVPMTVYVLQPDGKVNDVEELLSQHLETVDSHADALEQAFLKHGHPGFHGNQAG